MALYNLIEVLDTVSNIITDGFIYADISELLDDDENSGSLLFSAPDPDNPEWSIEYEKINSIPDNQNISKCSIPTNKACYGVSFQELATIHHALTNALEYFKECSADKSCPPEAKDEIKKSSVNCRNLQAKIGKFLNLYMR